MSRNVIGTAYTVFVFVFSMGRPLVNGDGSYILEYSCVIILCKILRNEDKIISGNKLCTGYHVINLTKRSAIVWEVLSS